MKKLIWIFICSVFLVSCTNQENVIIDWVDFVKINGKKYERVFSGVLADEDASTIGHAIGEVKFKIADHVHDVNYKIKEGDAAFREKGTKVFSIEGEPEFVAIQEENAINGYAIYHVDPQDQTLGAYKALDQKTIERIDIYKEDNNLNQVAIRTIKAKQEVEGLTRILNEGKTNANFISKNPQEDPTTYHLVFYTDGPIAYQYSVYHDGEQWYWMQSDTVLLSDDVEKFMLDK